MGISQLGVVRPSVLIVVSSIGLSTVSRAQIFIGTTGGAVHYDTQATSSSIAFNPEVRYERPGLVFDVGGGYTAGSDGEREGTGGGTLWLASHRGPTHIQFDALFQGSTTQPQAEASSTALFGLGEVAYAPGDRGFAVGAGAIQGSIAGTPSVTALRTEVRGWLVLPDNDLTFTGSIEPTELSSAWFTEFAAGIEWSPGDWDISGGLRVRSPSSTTSVGGTGSIARDLSDRISAELDFGRYLSDPYQGLPPGNFISLGIKLKLATWHTTTGEGVSAAELGDVTLKAAERSFGFGQTGVKTTGRSSTSLPSTAGGGSTSGRGTGNGHRP